jgi:flagellar basal body P-ring protein FlgI
MHNFLNTPEAHNSATVATALLALARALLAEVFGTPAQAARIKEVAAVEGVRSIQLTGFSLVGGLNGTGDQLIRELKQASQASAKVIEVAQDIFDTLIQAISHKQSAQEQSP